MNNKINRIHERVSRLVYSDHVSSFDELLTIFNRIKVWLLNFTIFFTVFIQVSWKTTFILTQIFHTTLGHAANFMIEIQKQWNIKQTISYLAPKIWSLIPNAIKSSESLDVFKSKIRQWEPDCPCRLCKNY